MKAQERGVFINSFTKPTTGNFIAGFGKERLTGNSIFFNDAPIES